MRDTQEDGERDKRSAPRFDPVAGIRAVADIQAEGLRAAGELLERVLGSEPDRSGPRSERPAGDYTALADAWVDLVRRTVAGLAQPASPGSVTVPVGGSNDTPPLVRLKLGEPESADDSNNGTGTQNAGNATEVWLHNGTLSPVGPLTLRCGQLSDPDGTLLEGVEVRFDPREVAVLQPVRAGPWSCRSRPAALRAQAPTAGRSKLPVSRTCGCRSK